MVLFKRNELLRFALFLILIPAIILSILFFLSPELPVIAIISGVLLGLFTVLMQLIALFIYRERKIDDFTKFYFYSLAARFFVVCTLFALVLILTKIDETGFTFSFIISYVCYSVFEVKILTNKMNHWNRPV